MKLRLAACIYAVLMLALAGFASTALAGGDHGNGHGNGNGNSGNGQQHSQQNQSQSSNQQQTTTTTSSNDNSNGVKPSNSTQHDTHAAASSNKTKKYGNGKTAGQIATKAGYGNSTLHGPGNSQPHKVNCGGHEVDVHALKNKKCGPAPSTTTTTTTTTTTQATTPTQTTPTVSHEDHKVTICHKTGSATNPYVEITVDYHALKNGHTAAKGDIIPAPAAGCPKATVAAATTTVTTTTTAAAAVAPAAVKPSAPAPAAPAKPAAAGAVLGATAPLHIAPTPKASGGVLGTTVRLGKSVGGTTLPFTGLPLWIFAAVAVGLILIGSAARRAGAER